ncbi:MAG: APC family permease [Bacteroidales bacterium]
MDAKSTQNSKRSYFSIGTIVALNIATVINIYGFPSEAFYGLKSISLYLIAILIFLIPVALISAEFGAMFPKRGGIYTWTSEAFSPRIGMFATWLQWIQSVFFYPLSLTFAAVTFSYIFPDTHISSYLSNNKFYIIGFILIVFWSCTFINLKNKLSNIGKISVWGVWIGIFIPVFLLIAFAIYYMFSGGKIEMETNISNIIPRFDTIDQVVMAVSILLFFSGLEVNGVHVHMMKNPSKDYPKALLLTSLIIGIIYILGTLAIAIIIPSNELNITQSVITALNNYLSYIGFKFFLPIIAGALAFGVLTNTLAWITGPASVLSFIASQGLLPKAIEKNNKNGAPVIILLTQAVIVTALSLIYVISSHVQQGYQMLLQMTNAIYLTMYIIMYASFIRLRYKNKTIERPYKAGKNLIQAWAITLVGLFSAFCCFILSFFPPAQLDISHQRNYIIILFGIYIILILPPIIYILFRKPDNKIKQD